MATAREVIMDVLRTDGEMQTYLAGGVWDRPLKPGARADLGDTPGAFNDLGVVKPAAVLQMLGVGQSFAGTALVGQLGASPPVRSRGAYVQFHEPKPGRATIEAAARRAEDLLDRRQFATDDLGVIVVKVTGSLGDNPGDPDINAELERVNLQITSVRRSL